MKRSLIFASLFFSASLLAQVNPNAEAKPAEGAMASKPKPKAKKSAAEREWPLPDATREDSPTMSLDPDGALRLRMGPLMNVVEDIESMLPPMRDYTPMGKAAETWEMPNLVWGDVSEHFVGSNLVLRNVTPLQAVTLAAAAAGCHLEPIYDVPNVVAAEGAEPVKRVIIGYKVEPGRESTGRGLEGGSGGGMGSAADASAVPTAIGAEISPVMAGATATAAVSPVTVDAAGADVLFTRVFSLGDALPKPKTEEEAKSRTERVEEIQSLIAQVLEMGGFKEGDESMKNLKVAVHGGSGALIVRGTTAQLNLIEQAIEALQKSQGRQ